MDRRIKWEGGKEKWSDRSSDGKGGDWRRSAITTPCLAEKQIITYIGAGAWSYGNLCKRQMSLSIANRISIISKQNK